MDYPYNNENCPECEHWNGCCKFTHSTTSIENCGKFKQRKYYIKKCWECGNEFKHLSDRARFCSKECSDKMAKKVFTDENLAKLKALRK